MSVKVIFDDEGDQDDVRDYAYIDTEKGDDTTGVAGLPLDANAHPFKTEDAAQAALRKLHGLPPKA